MKRSLWLCCLAVFWASSPALAQESSTEGERVVHTTIQPVRSGGLPLSEMSVLTESSREQIELRRAGVITKPHPVGPSLQAVDPTPPVLRAPGPPLRLAPGPLDLLIAGDPLTSLYIAQSGSPSTVVPGTGSSIVNEPSVVAVGETVFATGNWYAARSTDAGASFSYVDPGSGPFAAPATSRFCCDQVVAYDEPTDTLLWMQQFVKDGSTGIQRINVDHGADGSFECSYDISPQALGFAVGDWLDYPDMVSGGGYLYHSSNVFPDAGGFSGAIVTRWDMSQISTCEAASIHTYVNTVGDGSFKLSRGTGDTLYFATPRTTTTLRVFSWPTTETQPTWQDKTVTFWSSGTRVCPGPDGRDWCGFIDHRVQGAYVADGVVGFMWMPKQDATHPYPYVRFARFRESDLTLVDEPEFWSPDYAIVYPSLAVNDNGDLAGTFMWGGGDYPPACSVWIADDANGDVLQPVESALLHAGSTGPYFNRSGDYTSTHVYSPDGSLWTGVCFAYDTTDVGAVHYAVFGREPLVAELFADDFETGDLDKWGRVVGAL